MIYECTKFGFVGVLFPGLFLRSRVTGACPVATDLIMPVNIRTATSPTRSSDSIDFGSANLQTTAWAFLHLVTGEKHQIAERIEKRVNFDGSYEKSGKTTRIT